LVGAIMESMKTVIGLFLGFALGAVCRWFDIPVPSPPKLLGALLVVATTVGYMTVDRLMAKPATTAAVVTEVQLSGGATSPVPTVR
jgi:XapX domain-containing protein